MTASNKWLIGIGAALGALVVVAVVVAALTGGRQTKTYAEDTPEGAVQRYIQAIIDEDTDKAYGYLSEELQKKCTGSLWREQARYSYKLEESQVTLEKVRSLSDDKTVVTVSIVRVEAPNPFELGPREIAFDQEFRLQKQADGAWRFYETPWPVFSCPREEPAKLVPAVP